MKYTGLLKNVKSSNFYKVIIWVPMLISAGLFWYMTTHGIGLTPDSISYIGIADSIIDGKGLSVPFGFPPYLPLTQFPPLYPLLIAFISWLGLSIINSTQWLNFLLLISFFLVSNEILKKINPHNFWVRFSILSVLALSSTSLTIFSIAWSESLMIVLGLAAFMFLLKIEKKENKIVYFITGVIFALAILTRYAGITFLGTAVFYILMGKNLRWKTKFIHSLLLSAPGAILLSAWLGINYFTAGAATNRSIIFHLITIPDIHQLLNTIANWFLIPDTAGTATKFLIVLFVTLVFSVVFYSLFREKEKFTSGNIETMLVIFIFIYIAFIIMSKSLLDANIPLDFRILSPVYYALFFLLLAVYKTLTTNFSEDYLHLLFPITVLGFSLLSLHQNLPLIKSSHINGIGFNQVTWQTSETLSYINKASENKLLISNAPEPVHYFTDRPVYSLPKNYLKMQNSVNNQYDEHMSTLKSSFLDKPTLFIFFDNVPGSSVDAIAEINHYFKLNLIEKFNDATIYCYQPQQANSLCKN